MKREDIKPNISVRGPIFHEPVEVITVVTLGDAIKLIGEGLTTGNVHEPILDNGVVGRSGSANHWSGVLQFVPVR